MSVAVAQSDFVEFFSPWRRPRLVPLRFAYLLMWLGGVVSYTLLDGPPVDAWWTGSAFLLLAALIVIVSAPRRNIPGLAVAALAGYAAELAGVHSGLIFGEYRYTTVLPPVLLGVPVVMTGAWLVLVAYVRDLLSGLRVPASIEALLGGAWMTVIDLVIDPLASGRLAYWEWSGTGAYYGIPLHNFAGWFAVSAFVFLGMRALDRGRWSGSASARAVGLSVIVFFTVIAAGNSMYGPALIGSSLVLAHLGARARARVIHIEGRPSDPPA